MICLLSEARLRGMARRGMDGLAPDCGVWYYDQQMGRPLAGRGGRKRTEKIKRQQKKVSKVAASASSQANW